MTELQTRTKYTYDLLDDLQGVLQNGSRQRSFAYDSLSRLACASNPENSSAACPTTASGTYTTGTTGYTYDANGNLSSKTSPAPNQTGSATVTLSYCYDALNRLTSKAYTAQSCPMTSPIASYLYDQTAYNGLTITNGIGRRTGMTDQTGAEAWSFDSMGHATVDLRTTNNIAATTTNFFDYAGNLRGIYYPMYPTGGLLHVTGLSYLYNAANRQSKASGNHIGGVQRYFWFAESTFTPTGAPSSIVYGRANRPPSTPLSSALFYNSRLQPCRISVATTTSLPASCADSIVGNVLDLSYNFGLGSSDNGNVTSISNNRDSARSQMFTYDSLNRLLTAKTTSTSGTKCWDEQFTYDPWGNLQNIGRISGYSCSNEELLNVVATAKNQLLGYCYDAAGNLVLNTACPQGTFVPTYNYDAENHLISAGGVSYLYDGDGKRVEKVGVALYWYGGGSNLLTETDVTGSISNSAYHENIFFLGKRIARRDSASNITFQFSDHLGNVRNVTSTAGAILDDSDFYPFGGERQYQYTSGSQYKFTGKERDSESGLDNFGARYDSSSLGRFMSPDPKQIGTHMLDPQSFNRYVYARNNPLFFVDRDGRDFEKAVQDLNTFFHSLALKITVGAGLGEKWKVGSGVAKIEASVKGSVEFGGKGSLGDKLLQTSRSLEVGVTAESKGGPRVGEGITATRVTSTVYENISHPMGEEPLTVEVTDSIGGESTSVTGSSDQIGFGGEIGVGLLVGVEGNTTSEGVKSLIDAPKQIWDSLQNPAPPPAPSPTPPPQGCLKPGNQGPCQN